MKPSPTFSRGFETSVLGSMVWKFRYTLGIFVGVSFLIALHNPFGFWEFLGLLGIGVVFAAGVCSILLFLTEGK